MKFLSVAVFLAIFLAGGVDSAYVRVSSSRLTLSGTTNAKLRSTIEKIWAALTTGHRYPTINSGDEIALRSAHSSYLRYLMRCSTSNCYLTSCSTAGYTVMTPSAWSSCSSYMRFKITARGKMYGQPINSGDIVSLSSRAYGSSYRLRCSTSTSYKCRMRSIISYMSGNNWLSYNYATFQIFSRNAVDGTPVQYGDVIGFKYPYGSYNAWLYYSGGSYFYARSCSSTSKTSCARKGSYTGFKIFKKL